MKSKRGGETTFLWRDILFAGVGMSPGVLTETVWALAHRKKPPIIPHSVFVVTTASARNVLNKTLFDNGGWTRLVAALALVGFAVEGRLRFGPASEFYAVLPRPDGSGDLDDIVSAEDSAAAADCVMRALRGFTEDPGTRIVASIAGGRKTLSALVTSCVSLLGRSQDLLCHVLVNPPYDTAHMDPPFLFPEKGVTHRLSDGKTAVSSIRANVGLTELPVVKVRGLYEKEYRQLPGDYMTLVRRIQGVAPEPANYPEIVIDMNLGVLRVAESVIRLNDMEFALTLTLARILKHGWQLPPSWYDLLPGMEALQRLNSVPFAVDWHHKYSERQIDPDDFRKIASSVRSKVRATISSPEIADALIPSLRTASRDGYPRKRLKIIELRKGADVI